FRPEARGTRHVARIVRDNSQIERLRNRTAPDRLRQPDKAVEPGVLGSVEDLNAGSLVTRRRQRPQMHDAARHTARFGEVVPQCDVVASLARIDLIIAVQPRETVAREYANHRRAAAL